MPKRPIQHQLEDKSRAAFRLLLPDQWVFRDKPSDYGIDGEVELFDEHGQSQGLVFLVQLKATSSSDAKRNRRQSISLETLAYYRKLDLPVLVVRWIETENSFFYRWSGLIDPYNRREGAKTFSFQFADDELWRPDTPESLTDDLRRDQFIARNQVQAPIPVNIEINLPKLDRIDTGNVLSSIVEGMGSGGNQFSISHNASEALARMRITEDELRITLGMRTGLVLHGISRMSNEELLDRLPRFVISGLLVALSEVGQHVAVGQLFNACNLSAKDFPSRDAAFYVARSLFATTLQSEGLQLMEELRQESKDDKKSWEIEMFATISAIGAPPGNDTTVIAYLTKLAEGKLELGNCEDAGTTYYNLGNYLRAQGRNAAALGAFRRAARLNKKYGDRTYFLREVAGLLFDSRRFRVAAKVYAQAVKVDPNQDLEFLYADALLLSGEYEKAGVVFGRNLRADVGDGQQLTAEWFLKERIIKFVTERFEIASQVRRHQDAIDLQSNTGEWPKGGENELVPSVLELDALNPLFWFNYGVGKSSATGFDTDNWIEAFHGFLIAALINRNDVEAWTNVLACCFNHKQLHPVLPQIVECGYFMCGEQFVQRVYQEIGAQIPQGKLGRETLVELVEMVVSDQRAKKERSIRVRMFDDAGSHEPWTYYPSSRVLEPPRRPTSSPESEHP